jgi:patatin-like phospholipase/acyl hydrolase
MVCKYRVVLSIDGGGIKGLIPLRIITHLDSIFKNIDSELDIPTWVDIFSSTSASAIFTGAMMLKNSKGKTIHKPQEILDLYIKRGKQIFSKNTGIDSANSIYPLSFILDHYFGGITMESLKNHFLFLSYNRTSESPFVFSDTMDRYRNLSLSKVMTACSAYPGIFPAIQLGKMELVDGMLTAQNPAQMAYDYARMFYPKDPIVLISIGTGSNENSLKNQFEVEAEKIHQEMKGLSAVDKKILYFRFQPHLQSLTNYSFENETHSITDLLKETNEYIESNKSDFDRLLHLMEIRANS